MTGVLADTAGPELLVGGGDRCRSTSGCPFPAEDRPANADPSGTAAEIGERWAAMRALPTGAADSSELRVA
jgi:hypothetical protein